MRLAFKDLSAVKAKHSGSRVVLTTGTFDLFHSGHLAYLNKAKQYGDILVVGVNSDARTRRAKGPHRPIIRQASRAQVVAGIGAVDYSFVMPQSSRKAGATFMAIKKLRPDVFIVADKAWQDSKGFFDSQGVELVILPRVKSPYSTSRIIKGILAQ